MREELRDGDPRAVGPYRLTGLLGEGGQGAVFLGEGPDGQAVAVKVLHTRSAGNARARRYFAKELEAARQVGQFCTAAVLDADLDGDVPYIVSEFVSGPSLGELVAERGPLGGPALHRLAVGTATALTAIHRAGVVHRDFKPGNVIMADGPRVIDFGVARLLDLDATSTGVIGTPAYMAPEQVSGTAPGPAADMFAWAVTMLFAATGRPPFGGDSLPVVFHRILHDRPDVGMLAEPLRGLVAACLAKDPASRPSARDVLLGLVGHDVPTPTPTPTPGPGFRSEAAADSVWSAPDGVRQDGSPRTAGDRAGAAAGRTPQGGPGMSPPGGAGSRGGRLLPYVVSVAAAVTVTAALLITFLVVGKDRPGKETPLSKSSVDTTGKASPKASAPEEGVRWLGRHLGLRLRSGWTVQETDSGTHVLDGACDSPQEGYLGAKCFGFWVLGPEQIATGAHGSGYTGERLYYPAADVQPCFYEVGQQDTPEEPSVSRIVHLGAETARYREWTVDCKDEEYKKTISGFTQREWFIPERSVLVVAHMDVSGLPTALEGASWR